MKINKNNLKTVKYIKIYRSVWIKKKKNLKKKTL